MRAVGWEEENEGEEDEEEEDDEEVIGFFRALVLLWADTVRPVTQVWAVLKERVQRRRGGGGGGGGVSTEIELPGIENPIHLELELPGATDTKRDTANHPVMEKSEDGAGAAEEPSGPGRGTLNIDIDGFKRESERMSDFLQFLEQSQPSAGRRSSISGTNPMAQVATKPTKGLKRAGTFRL